MNALNRRMPVPHYSSSTARGWLTVRTTNATLRYKLGSGPFTARNTTLQLMVGGQKSTVAPTWDWECTFGQVCQAGAATLGGGAALGQTFPGYESTAGYAGFFVKPGASVTWHVIGSSGGSGGRFAALLQRGEPSAGTGSEHARPGRRRSVAAGHRRRSDDGGRAVGDVHHHRSAGGRDERHQGGQHHSEQLRPWPRHPGRRSWGFAAPVPRRPDPWEGGSGGSTPIPTTTHRRAGRDSPVTPAKP